jgi:NTE family protein
MKRASRKVAGASRQAGVWVAIALLSLTSGCEYVRPTMNAPLPQWDPAYGYRFENVPPAVSTSSDGLFIMAAFSGGGMRASALSYGVLRELARTPIMWEGYRKRLVDEVDIVSALSGGSFTAAYYALYGERIFHDFEYRFLRKDWESELRSRILWSPGNWFRLWSPYFGRAHILAELLDEALFDGQTFGDLVSKRQRPHIYIHASDMATVSRFEFNQRQFDLICSDLSKLPLSVATAASAALPLVLSPLSLKNYAGQCGFQAPTYLAAEDWDWTVWGRHRLTELRSYLDAEKRPYVHLLDGGFADNIGLRTVLETSLLRGDLESMLEAKGVRRIRKLVFLVVNAETEPDVDQYKLDAIPDLLQVMHALVDIPIDRYSADTLHFMNQAVIRWRAQIRQRAQAANSIFSPDADLYFINAGLSELEDQEEKVRLMKIPTGLALTDGELDRLLLAASRLVRNDKEFQRLLADLERSEGPPPTLQPEEESTEDTAASSEYSP